MHKQQIYADTDGLISAGILAVPRMNAMPKFFFSQLTNGYDLRTEANIIIPDMETQMNTALQNIDMALKQAEGGLHHIVRLSVFVKDDVNADPYAVVTVITETIQKFFSFARPGNMILPAQSVVFVSRLPYDHLGQIVGIEATAIID